MRLRNFGTALVLLGSLAGCGGESPQQARKVKAAPAPARDLLAEVRAAGANAGDVIEIAPLRDPEVTDLLQQAAKAEAQRQFKRAEASIAAALKITPNDPELLQQRAELLLARQRFDDAERMAWRSFELGPKIGGLCRRNWTAVQLAREARGDVAGAGKAAQQLPLCLVAPPVRM